MAVSVSIRIGTGTKERPDALEVHPPETCDNVIVRLTGMAIDDEPLLQEDLAALEEGYADIRAGRVHAIADVKREFGIE
ncbi:MAG TPA: hypothetical protein HA263_01805 [Methanoregulaceae archaeon]|nr:hypothetical protein [Methanoregulaceae archaeon]